MFVLVTYDVETIDKAGRGRLRKIARACLDWGQRVQLSVFEIELDKAQWTSLRARILGIVDEKRDSVRFYLLDSDVRAKVEHHGTKKPADLAGPLVV